MTDAPAAPAPEQVPDGTEAQEALRQSLEPGDLLFYKTKAARTFFELNPAAFGDDFPMLAAFAQALPYVLQPSGNMWSPHPNHYKPWHHVAICVAAAGDGPAKAVGYQQGNYDPEGHEVDGEIIADTSSLDTYDVVAVAGQHLSVLRHPTLDMGPAVEESSALAGVTGYSVLGLLSFALATKARMLPAGAVRDETLLMAYGAHRRARTIDDAAVEEGEHRPESCVTALAIALEKVLDGRFPLPEPAAPSAAETAKLFAYQLSPLTEALTKLLERIERAGGALALAQIPDMTVETLTATIPRFADQLTLVPDGSVPGPNVLEAVVNERRRVMGSTLGIGVVPDPGLSFLLGPGFGGPGFGGGGGAPEPPPDVPPGDSPYSPGPGTSTEEYIPKLEGAAEILTDDPDDDKSLVDLGVEELANQPVPSSRHLVASPAMLWDALTNTHGFEEFFPG